MDRPFRSPRRELLGRAADRAPTCVSGQSQDDPTLWRQRGSDRGRGVGEPGASALRRGGTGPGRASGLGTGLWRGVQRLAGPMGARAGADSGMQEGVEGCLVLEGEVSGGGGGDGVEAGLVSRPLTVSVGALLLSRGCPSRRWTLDTSAWPWLRDERRTAESNARKGASGDDEALGQRQGNADTNRSFPRLGRSSGAPPLTVHGSDNVQLRKLTDSNCLNRMHLSRRRPRRSGRCARRRRAAMSWRNRRSRSSSARAETISWRWCGQPTRCGARSTATRAPTSSTATSTTTPTSATFAVSSAPSPRAS